MKGPRLSRLKKEMDLVRTNDELLRFVEWTGDPRDFAQTGDRNDPKEFHRIQGVAKLRNKRYPLVVVFTDSYPFVSPVVKFPAEVPSHECIGSDGVYNFDGDWSPALTTDRLLLMMFIVLTDKGKHRASTP